jgi:hypothetical protein
MLTSAPGCHFLVLRPDAQDSGRAAACAASSPSDFGAHLCQGPTAGGLGNVKIVVGPNGPGKRRRPVRQAETVKNFADGFGWGNGRNDTHSTAATIALENVHGKYAFHKLSP